ncbi:FkbM family methyltransferase [Pantanalinema rosaneae CENA516]|uniref:FkbM family methyltransferase n=1 Tax=Pantanalinema rosaneae TaxID=1620701 RepID=UPI003D6EF6B3
MSKPYTIGRYTILLPPDHPLDRYQENWRRYDTALGYIAQVVFQKYANSTAIDIGANVGDSAALIRSYADIPVLCIEGNPEFLEYLEHNAGTIGNIELAACFIGQDGEVVDLDQIVSERGTASIAPAATTEQPVWFIEMHSLNSILQLYPSFQTAKLLKIDTDGFDFTIIQTSVDVLSQLQPILYFEYDISFNSQGDLESLATIQQLVEIGYQHFIVYDNFGNYVMSGSGDVVPIFRDLNTCLLSNRQKSGTPTIYYWDICAFTPADTDLFEQIRTYEYEFVRG